MYYPNAINNIPVVQRKLLFIIELRSAIVCSHQHSRFRYACHQMLYVLFVSFFQYFFYLFCYYAQLNFISFAFPHWTTLATFFCDILKIYFQKNFIYLARENNSSVCCLFMAKRATLFRNFRALIYLILFPCWRIYTLIYAISCVAIHINIETDMCGSILCIFKHLLFLSEFVYSNTAVQ